MPQREGEAPVPVVRRAPQSRLAKGLDRKGIDLGQGKRMLVRGGKLDTKFNITVPENLDAGG